jgi:hypothetical protein
MTIGPQAGADRGGNDEIQTPGKAGLHRDPNITESPAANTLPLAHCVSGRWW